MAKLSYSEYRKKNGLDDEDENKKSDSWKIPYSEAQSRAQQYGSLEDYSREKRERDTLASLEARRGTMNVGSKEIDDDTWKSIQDRYLGLVNAASGDKDLLRNAAGDRSRIGRMTPVMEKGDKWYSLPTVRNESSATKVLGARKNAFDKEASSLMSDLDKYSSVLGDKGKDMKARLQQISGMYGGTVAQSQASDQFYGSFKDQDDYNRWSIGWDESRTGDESFVDNAETRQKRKEYYDYLGEEIGRLWDEYEFETFTDENGNKITPTTREEAAEWEKKTKEKINALEAERTKYERMMSVQDKYSSLMDKPDFERHSTTQGSGRGFGNDSSVYQSINDNIVTRYLDLNDKYALDETGRFKVKNPDKIKDILDPYVDISKENQKIFKIGRQYNLEEMTEDEKKIYSYILNTQGDDAAQTYLDEMKTTLNRRSVQREEQAIRNAGGLELAIRNIASVPQNILGGVGEFISDAGTALSGGEINPYDEAHRDRLSASMARSETARRIDDATGGASLAGISWGDLYNTGMSVADSAAGAYLFNLPIKIGNAQTNVYTIMMGMGAASDEMKRLYESGASAEQVGMGGVLAGVAEALFEEISLEKFTNRFIKSKPKNIAEFAKNFALQSFTEGSEELLTDVSNSITNTLVMNSESDWNKAVRGYMEKGNSEGDAWKLAFTDKLIESWKDFAGGAISGGLMGGIGGAVNLVSNKSETRSEGKAIKNADTTSSVLNMGKELVGDITDAKAKKSLQNAIESVEKKPTNKTVGNLSRAISEAINTVADEDTREALNVKYGAARVLGLDTRENTKLYNNVDVSDKVSDTGSAVNTETGENIEISETNPIAKVENGEVYLNTDKGEVKQSEVKYSTEQQAKLLENVSDLPTAVANAIVENYSGQQNVEQYVSAMREGILHYGYNNVTAENVPRSTAFKSLSAEDRQYALAQGRALAAEDIKAAEAKVANLPSQLKRNAAADEVVYKAEKAPGASGTGGVVWTKGDVNFDTDVNKANAAGARVVAAAFGKNIVLYDSKTVNDSTLKNANGKYVGSDGTIYLDINGNSDGGMMYTLSHEMTHEAEKWARREYRAFADFLIQNYAKKGVTVKELIDRKMMELNTEDEDLAYSEVIADAAENMLLDSDALDKLTELVEKHGADKGWVEKLKSWIKTALDWIRSAYEHVSGASSREANEVAEFGKAVEKLRDLWSKAVVAAAENRAAAVESKDVFSGVETVDQFQMKAPIEQTKNLIAVHNLSVSELEKSLDLGGLPMPSIAIIRAGQGHSEYGDVSIVFPKDAIDPQRNKDNKIYSGDAWTPTFPKIEYKINEKVESKIRKKYYDLYYKYGREAVDALYPWGNYAEDQLNREGGEKAVFERYADDTDMMNVFLVDTTGKRIEPVTVTKTKEMDDDLKKESAFLLDRLGQDLVDELEMSAESSSVVGVRKFLDKHGEQYDEYLKDMYSKVYNLSQQEAENIVDNMSKRDRYIKLGNVLRFRKNEGVQVFTETDIKATEKAIRDATNKEEYNQWLKELFSGIEGKKGIYNNRERYTPSGNLRSFEALHYEITLDNIIREMKSHENAETMFGGNAVWGAAAKLFKSIDEVKSDAGRIYKADYEEYKKIKEKYIERLSSISLEVLGDSLENKDTFDRFTLLDSAAGAIAEAIKGKRTVDSVMRSLREYKYLKNVNEDVARKIIDLADDIASMPTEYFEAKPERAVMFDEAAAVIVPDTTSEETKQRVRDLGSTITEYKAGDEKSRLEALNSVEGVQFQQKKSTSMSIRAIVDRAMETLDKGSAEYNMVSKYKTELDKLDTMRAELDEAIKSGDKQAETKLRNNIKTQNGILTRIENSNVTQNVTALKDVAKLTKDVKNLREMLRLQAKETGGTIASKTSAETVAKELMDKYGVKRGKGELAGMISRLYTELISGVNDRVLNVEYMRDLSRDAAEWIAEHQAKEYEGDDAAQEVLDYLKGKKVWLNDQQKGDIRHKYDGQLNKWMGRLSGYVTVTNDKSAMPLDDLWNDLSKQFPAEFGKVSDADQGWMLADKLSDLKERANHELVNHGLTDEQMEEWTDQVTDAVYESLWNIKPMETVADKYKKQITELKEKHRADMSALRKSFADTIREERSTMYAEAKERARDYREKIDTRRKLKKLAERMKNAYENPKVNNYIPASLAKPTLEVLKELNFDTKRGSKLADAFGKLKLEYDALVKNSDGVAEYSDTISDLIEQMRQSVKGVRVQDMTREQLEDVYITLKAFDHVIRDARVIHGLGTDADSERNVYEVGEDWTNEILEAKDAKRIINKYSQKMLRPSEFFERLASYKKDSTSSQIYKMLNRAARRMAMIEMESNMIFSEILKDSKYVEGLSSLKDKNLVDIGLKDSTGKPIKITRGMMLAYYMHTLNEDNARHVAIGGLKAPNFKQYYNSKADAYSNGVRIPGLVGKELAAQYEKILDTLEGEKNKKGVRIGGLNEEIQEAIDRYDQDKVEQLLDEKKALYDERDAIIERGMQMVDEIRKTIENKLSDKDRAFIKAAQDYFGNYSKNVLNEATMRMYGFEKARVENYFPIHSDANFLKAAFETVARDASLENKGFMKDRVKAANPIMLEDFASVINSQIGKTAQYAAFAPALREFGKIYSTKTGGVAADNSVMEAVSQKFGQAGLDYLSNLVADMNGARRRDASFLDKARGKYAQAVLTLNPRVSMVQAASYPSAAAVVGHKALVKALAAPDGNVVLKRADKKLIAKYTARLWQRNRGGADVTLHDAKSINNLYNRVNSKLRFLTGWIEAVDAGTVGRLWYASEYYVRDNFKDLERGSDAYYEKTAEVFNKVVEETQPNYTVLQRPDILRNPNQLVRSLFMFMTQRLQNFNILYGAARRYAKYSSDLKNNGRNGVTKEDVGEARLDLWRAASSQLLAAGSIAGLKLLADVLLHNIGGRRRDKDTGEITKKSLWLSVVDDFTSSLVSDVLGGSEAYSAIKAIATGGKYYNPSIGGIDTITNLITNSVNLAQKIADPDKDASTSDYTKLGFTVAELFGISAKNGYAIGNGLWNHTQDIKNGKFGSFDAGYEIENKQYANRMYNAIEAGDEKAFKEAWDSTKPDKGSTVDKTAAKNLTAAIETRYLDGDVSEEQAEEWLAEYCGKDSKQIYTTLEKWNLEKEGGEKGDYKVYDKFAEAVRTGKDLKAVIKEYKDAGYTEDNLNDAIRNSFKAGYIAASNAERAKLKGYLLNAYVAVGYDKEKYKNDDAYREKKSDDIDKWVEE